MSRFFAMFLATLLPALAGAEDWRCTLSPMQPGPFPLPRPYIARYDFGWSGVKAGSGTFDFKRAGQRAVLVAQLKTLGMPRRLWQADASHRAVADLPRLRPISVVQKEVYRSQTQETRLLFSPQGVTKQTRESPEQKEFLKPKTVKEPGALDLLTTVLVARSQPLRQGDVLRCVVFPSNAAFLAEFQVLGREKVTVPAGTFEAIKLELSLKKIGNNGDLQRHAKFKSGTIWLSDDQDRLIVRVAVEVFVGSVWAELQGVEFGK